MASDMDLVHVRRALHAIPEIGLCEYKTSKFLADRLEALGLEVSDPIAGTGLVATLQRGEHPFCLGFRADMDGLPMDESQKIAYTSRHRGCMHACGHDGHMAMLLGAAQALARDPEFEGTVRFIFQPAEENIGGARLMIAQGLFERFPCDMIFGLHNMPGIPVGQFAGKAGALMASIDDARIRVNGKGGHGAQPETTVDPILIGAHIVTALQSVISRNIHPARPGVVTVGSFHGGAASNIIPDQAVLEASFRATDPESRACILERVEKICTSTASGFGGGVEIDWQTGYPVLVNHDDAFNLACQVIKESFGSQGMALMPSPIMVSEDFAYMLEQVPGAFFFIGNGDTASLHNASYDFNDQAIPHGVKFYENLSKRIFSRVA